MSPYFVDSILSSECEEMHILCSIVLRLVIFLSFWVKSDKKGHPCVKEVFDFLLFICFDESFRVLKLVKVMAKMSQIFTKSCLFECPFNQLYVGHGWV